MAESRGRVFLVGAGPGAPDLITLRGADVMSRADVVVYDSLVNPQLLALAGAAAEFVHVGRRGGEEHGLPQDEINRLLIDRARQGLRVVRLKGGDPFIFGRGGEEADALARAQVAFEVVPGVTSATAAPAFAGIPLTHREHGSFVAFVTGHEDDTKRGATAVPWRELAEAAALGGTLVILMASARLATVLANLVRGGVDPLMPAAAVHWGSTADQRSVRARVGTLAAACEREKLGAPAVVVVGACASLAAHLGWVEKLPLFGKRVVVTRARDDASALAAELRALGADAIEFPTIEFAPPSSYGALDAALARLEDFDWLIFTSARGVDAFIARIADIGCDVRAAARALIGAIGPATASRVNRYGLTVAAMPSEYRAEALASAIGPGRIRGRRFLVARAEHAREVLPEALRGEGAAEVCVAPAYRTLVPSGAAVERLRDIIVAQPPDLVAFTSSSTVRNYCILTGRPGDGQQAAAIGPITEATARECGFDVVVRPAEYTIPALAAALSSYFGAQRLEARAS